MRLYKMIQNKTKIEQMITEYKKCTDYKQKRQIKHRILQMIIDYDICNSYVTIESVNYMNKKKTNTKQTKTTIKRSS
jgi:hypothetical protein